MRNLARCICALLIVFFALAPGASAQEEGQDDASEFVRAGFYVGGGGSARFPINWDRDFDDDLTELASQLSLGNAAAALSVIDSTATASKRLITVDGTDLEDDYWYGVNGVIGYRAGPRAAFELEYEGLIGSNKSKLDVSDSTGTHTVEVAVRAVPRPAIPAACGAGIRRKDTLFNIGGYGRDYLGESVVDFGEIYTLDLEISAIGHEPIHRQDIFGLG